tara:strand:- start:208 stop:414 length:207 start_codon:yes stop_codon:yes gene_type:complete
MIRVEGHQHLYRDEKTGAIVNCDSVAYNQYVSTINRRNLQKKELSDMRAEIDELKSLVKEILNGNESR